MERPEVTVALIEDNATRADLYGHWLDHLEVRTALTKQQVLDVVDGDVTVAVLAEEFGDGAAAKVLELIRSRTRYCQVVTTAQDRSRVVPKLDVDNHLTKPIFEEALTERVEELARQTVFCELLEEYYRTTIELTTVRNSEDDSSEREARLEERAAELKPMIAGLRADLNQDDMHVVADLVSREREPDEEATDKTSKYIPDKCYNCERKWGVGRGTDPSKGAVRLGSHVWRCTNCGHIQMGATAGNPRLTRPR